MSLTQITSLLSQLSGSSEFAVQTTLPADSLQLTVGDLKNLSLPITPAYAKKLISRAEMAPYGYKEQTLLDGNVRATWKIVPDEVKILSDDWAQTLQAQLDEIKIKLGLSPQSELRAELHDLLIYEPGQFFKPHQDSEKCDGMIATLVVVLPCKHKGGALVVKHQNQSKELQSDQEQEELSLFAFYADCRHEVLPVTSGYRVALTYNLVLRKPQTSTAPSDNQGLAHLLKQYFADPNNTELVYLLDHEYTQAGLSWDMLKGIDDERVALFKQCAEQLDLDIYLCLAEAHELWDCEYEYRPRRGRRSYYDDDEMDGDAENAVPTDLIEDSLALTQWLGNNGQVIELPEYDVSKNSICYTTDNEDFDPFRNDHEGWMGNYGNTLERWYHRAAVILWPKSAHYCRLLSIAPLQLIDELLAMAQPQEVVAQILPDWTGRDMAQHAEKIAQLALKLNNPIQSHTLLKPLGSAVLQVHHVECLEALGQCYGQEWLSELIHPWLSDSFSRFPSPPNLIERIFPLIQAWVKHDHHQIITQQLLAHQLPISFKSHQSSLSRLASHKADSKKRINELKQLWNAAQLAQHSEIQQQLLSQVENHADVYDFKEQAIFAVHIQQPSNLAKSVTQSLQTALAQPVRAEGDWAIQQHSCCACADCKELNQFLGSKTQAKIWPLAEQRRRHIHNAIGDLGIPVTHETERRGSPYKLHLVKTEQLFKDELALRKEWQQLLEQLSALP